jgi:hypothetical protein
MRLEEAIQKFLEDQDDSLPDEWYATDKEIYTTVMTFFLKYLLDKDITINP